MMGTQAGAQKARETRARKVAARQAAEAKRAALMQQAEQLEQSREQSSVLMQQSDGFTDASETRSDVLMGTAVATVGQQGQVLSAQVLDTGSVEAAAFIVGLVRNRKASSSMRFQAACKVLDLTVGASQKGKQQPPSEAGQLAMLERIGAALGVRKPVTVDVKPGAIRDEPVETVATAVTPTE